MGHRKACSIKWTNNWFASHSKFICSISCSIISYPKCWSVVIHTESFLNMLIEVIRTESLKIYNRSSINQVRTWAFTLIHYSVFVSPITLENWNICAAICFRVLKLRTMLLSIFLDEWSCWLNGQWLGGTMWCKYHFLLTDVFTRNCASSLVYRFVNMNMIRFRSRKNNEMPCFWALKIKKN